MTDTTKVHSSNFRDFVSPDELKALQAFAPARVIFDIGSTWVLILAALVLAAYANNGWILSACFVLIASRQLALTHLVHDASHYRLFRSRTINDAVGDLLLAGPVAISTASYRAQHLPHHQHLGEFGRDTDQRSWYSIKGSRFLRMSLQTLLGWEAVITFRSYAGTPSGGTDQGDLPRRLACTALSNAGLLAFCWWLGQPHLYLLLWLLPLLTLTMLLQNYRVIAEHQTEAYAARGVDRDPRSFSPPLTRTLRAGPVGRFLIGPMNFNFHHEHHLQASVPYHQLPQFHQLLTERGYYGSQPEALGQGYAPTLWRLVFPRAHRDPKHA